MSDSPCEPATELPPALSDEVIRDLLPHAERVAAWFAQKHRINLDDAKSDAAYCLLSLVRRYKADLGVPLRTYVLARMTHALIDCLRARQPAGARRSGSTPGWAVRSRLAGQTQSLNDLMEDFVSAGPVEPGDSPDHALALESILETLRRYAGRHWPIVEAILGRITMEQAARQIGISPSRASQIKTDLVAEFRSWDWLRADLAELTGEG